MAPKLKTLLIEQSSAKDTAALQSICKRFKTFTFKGDTNKMRADTKGSSRIKNKISIN
ncbi:hypothetical protein CSG_1310 [Campylobacter fetus subsp. venerealis str. 84-112]|uniref:Uncharacterized protein n=1 Tax=Campylobacter fetus subsp. fetus (strain 82-40) TaxID=360106 RepID=A0RMA6_CAMFF|nr:hypothetical protein CFF8240_0130 [Campylobacter fetus subsp. fetus 82-40]CDF64051.1 hypothetical protein CSG_1310 [Campylobacter fetus subsp. venerealis str. 84-112]